MTTIEKDIEYLDKEFPKGKTKFRGEAMVLLALAREEGENELRKKEIEFLMTCINNTDSVRKRIKKRVAELREKLIWKK